jgi:hypothetical protein
MNNTREKALFQGILIVILLCASSVGKASKENFLQSPEGVVNELYKLVTFESGHTPDWNQVKSLFIDQAVIVLRTSRENTTIFSVQGFVDDFVNFIEKYNAEQTGFKEEIKRMNSKFFGDTAHIFVLYEASIPGLKSPPQQGVDSFLLIKKEGRWWIVAITNEIPKPDMPVPPDLFD